MLVFRGVKGQRTILLFHNLQSTVVITRIQLLSWWKGGKHMDLKKKKIKPKPPGSTWHKHSLEFIIDILVELFGCFFLQILIGDRWYLKSMCIFQYCMYMYTHEYVAYIIYQYECNTSVGCFFRKCKIGHHLSYAFPEFVVHHHILLR